MPVKVSDHLPAVAQLARENIFVMTETRANVQDIRPLKIAILNLMPTKIETETQLLRLIGNTPLQVDITLLRMASHSSKNTPHEHLDAFYKTFAEVAREKFDGLIITGAPVEQIEFEDVTYWDELVTIMEWAHHNVQSTLNICWAAQAALYYRYGVKKRPLPKKHSGVYRHKVHNRNSKLVRGFDDYFDAPHSRHTEILEEDIQLVPELEVLATSDEVGVFLVATRDEREVFITGHAEYSADTLYNEYVRDMAKGLEVEAPKHYFKDDDPAKEPVVTWRSHANLLFLNWLNYFVYQETPFDTSLIGEE